MTNGGFDKGSSSCCLGRLQDGLDWTGQWVNEGWSSVESSGVDDGWGEGRSGSEDEWKNREKSLWPMKMAEVNSGLGCLCVKMWVVKLEGLFLGVQSVDVGIADLAGSWLRVQEKKSCQGPLC